MNILCYLIKFFLTLFLLIYQNQYKYIFLILLLLLLQCSSFDYKILNLIFNVFLLLNVFIVFVNNLNNTKFNLVVLTVYLIYILKTISEFKNNTIIFLLNIIALIAYFFSVNISLKFKNYISKLNIIQINKFLPKKNLRVALCVSGRFDKNIKKIYNSWKDNLLKYYNVDIFMNTNEENNFIKNVIKPKKIIIYNDQITKNNNLHKYANLMFYRIYETNKYKTEYENKYKFKYDLVIRLRSDILLNERLYLENFNDNKIYFPFKENICESGNIYSLGITDQFFIGKSKIMNNVCGFYLNLEKYNYIKCKISEVSLLYYLKNNSIIYSQFKYDWIINYYNNNLINNLKFYKRSLWIFSQSCFINLS